MSKIVFTFDSIRGTILATYVHREIILCTPSRAIDQCSIGPTNRQGTQGPRRLRENRLKEPVVAAEAASHVLVTYCRSRDLSPPSPPLRVRPRVLFFGPVDSSAPSPAPPPSSSSRSAQVKDSRGGKKGKSVFVFSLFRKSSESVKRIIFCRIDAEI